jgi:hypothetical protein
MASKNGEKAFYSSLDKGIAFYVRILRDSGIETFESCEGGKGHSYPEPTIRFFGGQGQGFKALCVAQEHALPIRNCLPPFL